MDFIGKELARMETNVLDWLEATAAAVRTRPLFSMRTAW